MHHMHLPSIPSSRKGSVLNHSKDTTRRCVIVPAVKDRIHSKSNTFKESCLQSLQTIDFLQQNFQESTRALEARMQGLVHDIDSSAEALALTFVRKPIRNHHMAVERVRSCLFSLECRAPLRSQFLRTPPGKQLLYIAKCVAKLVLQIKEGMLESLNQVLTSNSANVGDRMASLSIPRHQYR